MLKLFGKICLVGYNIGLFKLAIEYGKMAAELFVQYGNIYYQIYALVAFIVFVLGNCVMNVLIKELKEELAEENN